VVDPLPFDEVVTDREIADRIRHARKQSGLTQVEVARRRRKTVNTVASWERGEHKIDAAEWINLLDVLGFIVKVIPKIPPGPPSKAWNGAGKRTVNTQDVGCDPL
jgi:DNA-binding XRE family transcriptional regulator